MNFFPPFNTMAAHVSPLLSIYLQLVNGFYMFTVKYWTTCIVLRENNTNSSVTRKRHMDMVRKQQLLIDSLLGKSAEDTQSFEKKSLNFSQIIVHFLSLQDVNGLRLFLVLGGGGSGVISTVKQTKFLRFFNVPRL